MLERFRIDFLSCLDLFSSVRTDEFFEIYEDFTSKVGKERIELEWVFSNLILSWAWLAA